MSVVVSARRCTGTADPRADRDGRCGFGGSRLPTHLGASDHRFHVGRLLADLVCGGRARELGLRLLSLGVAGLRRTPTSDTLPRAGGWERREIPGPYDSGGLGMAG